MHYLYWVCSLWPFILRNIPQFLIFQSFSSSLSFKGLDLHYFFNSQTWSITSSCDFPSCNFLILNTLQSRYITALSRDRTSAGKLHSFSITFLFFYNFCSSHLLVLFQLQHLFMGCIPLMHLALHSGSVKGCSKRSTLIFLTVLFSFSSAS